MHQLDKWASSVIKFFCLFISIFLSSSLSFAESRLAGGALTIHSSAPSVFRQPAPHLPAPILDEFLKGRRIFDLPWTAASVERSEQMGLGPLFNSRSCFSCHIRDGRGRAHLDKPISALQKDSYLASEQLLLKIQHRDRNQPAHPQYGSQFQSLDSREGVLSEGQVIIHYEELELVLADGTKRSLRKPYYELRNLRYGEINFEDYSISPRVAPANFGLGLLEAISDEDLLALADPEDKNQDGISGKISWGFDRSFLRKQIGRFGWKANQPNVRQQNAAALHHDMGIRNRLFPFENCGSEQIDCLEFDRRQSSDFEINDFQLSQLTLYIHLLGVPAARVRSASEKRGQKIFEDIQCAACHHSSFVTDSQYEGLEYLMEQKIYPYTDLLLHDMGPGLADQGALHDNSQEWRTPPLWGLGLYPKVNGHSFLLHDGRARNIEEAILWHGGEAEKSKNLYMSLERTDREALLNFLKAL